jgi:hypothetical protein
MTPVFESYSGVRKRESGEGPARGATGGSPGRSPSRMPWQFFTAGRAGLGLVGMRSGEVSSLGQARREFLRKESPWGRTSNGRSLLSLLRSTP